VVEAEFDFLSVAFFVGQKLKRWTS